MTFQINDDNFANRELSIEELETIAAGGWFSSIEHAVEHGVGAVVGAVESVVGSIASTASKLWGPSTVYARSVPHKVS
jgi:hypothetical protein